MIASLLVAVAVAAADPCAPVERAASADPGAASTYRAVAEAEEEAGSRDTAILAYRSAAALDPADSRSRAALERYCGAGPAVDPFREGLARMDAGDLRGAIADFRTARKRADDPSLALLEGICQYELGDVREARPLLRRAERSPDDADLARLYLGLIALREGAASEAASLFDAASASAAIAPVAADLARLARSEGTWAITFTAASGYDSNVNLAPPGAPPAREADGLYTFGATGLLRPWGWEGPYLRGQGILNQQFTLGAFNVAGGDLAGGWQLRGGRWSAVGEYDLAYRTFGGSPFVTSHRLLASASTVVASDVMLGATYFARFESYADGFSPFSGTVQGFEARASFPAGSRARLALVYGLARDVARLSILSYLEHGPRAELRVLTSRGSRLGVDLAATFRGYDAYDTTLGTRRRDTYLDAAAFMEWDLSAGWAARAALRGRRALSDVSGFEYAKLVPMAGLAYTFSP
jgi:tetratricopeptide (TPR) repeat protein